MTDCFSLDLVVAAFAKDLLSFEHLVLWFDWFNSFDFHQMLAGSYFSWVILSYWNEPGAPWKHHFYCSQLIHVCTTYPPTSPRQIRRSISANFSENSQHFFKDHAILIPTQYHICQYPSYLWHVDWVQSRAAQRSWYRKHMGQCTHGMLRPRHRL